MADSGNGPARSPKAGSDSVANSSDRRCEHSAALVARAIARVDALTQVLHAITCAGELLTVANQFREAADQITSKERNALRDVLDAEFKRRLRIAKAAVAAMRRSPTHLSRAK